MKRTLTTFAALGILLGATACNTVKGAGQDVEYVGEKIEEGAEKVEEELDD